MRKDNIVKYCCAIGISGVMLLNSIFVYAASTKSELNSQMGDINDQINATKTEINGVKE